MSEESINRLERLAYRPHEAAQSLGVSRQHLYNEIRRGRLRTTMSGRRRLITRAALLEYLGETEAEAVAR